MGKHVERTVRLADGSEFPVELPEGVSGWELASKLRKQKPHLKVIFTSGYSVDLASQTMAQEPGFQFLQKPFKPHSLALAVRECLNA